ncbi:MAG TPA: hypothetical protein VFQ60_02850 [Patescibacteria group bacterium]|nr:hypothetical protein [Patescibacteria group bacterium]
MATADILSLFHHIHHVEGQHKVHHCGGAHREIDPTVNYTIEHCACGKHRIDQQEAVGHATGSDLALIKVSIHFQEPCPEGGWHVESGVVSTLD